MKNIIVVKAEYTENLSLQIWFNDATSRIIDFGEFIDKHPHPQYNKYKKPSLFKQFTIRCGNIIWGKHADLSFPIEALYTGNLEYN